VTEAESVFARLSREIAANAAAVAPAIVQVLGRPRRPASGVVVGPERVLTTSHSVEWEDGLTVATHEDVRLDATVIGHARGADLVLLRVPGLKAPALRLAAEAPRPGELALLAGRSWRGHAMVRLAVIAGVAGPVQTRDGTRLDRILSLGAAPYPGFSGSALVGTHGDVIGIATAGIVRGAALALPAPAVAELAAAIERHGGVRRGFLGVTSQPAHLPARQRGTLPRDRALIVLGVADDSPADRAGVLVGDIMVQADGADLDGPEDLLALLGPERVGRPLDLLIVRGAEQKSVTVTVGERPARA
jgi:S1-C subfamily serine protease